MKLLEVERARAQCPIKLATPLAKLAYSLVTLRLKQIELLNVVQAVQNNVHCTGNVVVQPQSDHLALAAI